MIDSFNYQNSFNNVAHHLYYLWACKLPLIPTLFILCSIVKELNLYRLHHHYGN